MKLLIQILSAYMAVFPLVAKEPTNWSSLFQVRLVVDQPTEDSEAMTMTVKGTGKTIMRTINVQKKSLIDLTVVAKAAVTKHPLSGKPLIEITLTDEGRKQFAEVTRKYIRQELAIIFDGKIYTTFAGEAKDGIFPLVVSESQTEATLTVKKLNAALKGRH